MLRLPRLSHQRRESIPDGRPGGRFDWLGPDSELADASVGGIDDDPTCSQCLLDNALFARGVPIS